MSSEVVATEATRLQLLFDEQSCAMHHEYFKMSSGLQTSARRVDKTDEN